MQERIKILQDVIGTKHSPISKYKYIKKDVVDN